MRPGPKALSTTRWRSQSTPSRLRPMVTVTGDEAAAGSAVSSSASAAHSRYGMSLMEALMRGGGGSVGRGIAGAREAAGHSRKGGDANGTQQESLRDCDSLQQAK